MFKGETVISVAISINGNPIMARSATNVGDMSDGRCKYLSDDGIFVLHNPDEGAVKLAIKLLENIKEMK